MVVSLAIKARLSKYCDYVRGLCAQLGRLFSTTELQTSTTLYPLTWAWLIYYIGHPGAKLPDTVLIIREIIV